MPAASACATSGLTAPSRFDERRGNVRPGGLEFVAVADHAAQEIRGAAGNAREPLGEQAAGAAFGGGDGGVVHGQLAPRRSPRAIGRWTVKTLSPSASAMRSTSSSSMRSAARTSFDQVRR